MFSASTSTSSVCDLVAKWEGEHRTISWNHHHLCNGPLWPTSSVCVHHPDVHLFWRRQHGRRWFWKRNENHWHNAVVKVSVKSWTGLNIAESLSALSFEGGGLSFVSICSPHEWLCRRWWPYCWKNLRMKATATAARNQTSTSVKHSANSVWYLSCKVRLDGQIHASFVVPIDKTELSIL